MDGTVSAGSFFIVLEDSDCIFFTDSSCAKEFIANRIRINKKTFFIAG
jgi:hypothetical protein